MIKLLFVVLYHLAIGIAGWRMYEKAGQSGWVSFIPILNILGLVKMAGRPLWWAILYLVPFLDILVHVIVSVDVARRFGKSALFGLAMAFPLLTPFCVASIGLGEARYLGAARRG
jgi:hypothetical protein